MEENVKEGNQEIDFEKNENPSSETISSESKSGSETISSETVQDLEESKEIENMKKVEAALFLSARFLEVKDLVMLTDINPLMVKELLEKLKEKYNNDDSAIQIVEKNKLWKMDVEQEYVDMINKLATGSSEFSRAEQETLAVIAYKQPVKQSVIIKIRGNKAYEHVKKFIDVGLIQAKKAGHTKELSLSDDFFDYFHIRESDTEQKPEIYSVSSKSPNQSPPEKSEDFDDMQEKGREVEGQSEDEGGG